MSEEKPSTHSVPTEEVLLAEVEKLPLAAKTVLADRCLRRVSLFAPETPERRKHMRDIMAGIEKLRRGGATDGFVWWLVKSLTLKDIPQLTMAMSFDAVLLKQLVSEDALNAGAIESESLGSLWPYGEPLGWVEDDPSNDEELTIEIDVPNDATDEQVIEVVKELVVYADSLHRAMGGNGVEIRSLEAAESVPAPEKVVR